MRVVIRGVQAVMGESIDFLNICHSFTWWGELPTISFYSAVADWQWEIIHVEIHCLLVFFISGHDVVRGGDQWPWLPLNGWIGAGLDFVATYWIFLRLNGRTNWLQPKSLWEALLILTGINEFLSFTFTQTQCFTDKDRAIKIKILYQIYSNVSSLGVIVC